METFLSGKLDEVLVGANTSGLEGLRAQLLILVGDEVNAEREVVDGRALSAKIEDANLGIRDTAVEAGLGVRLGGSNASADCPKITLRPLSRPLDLSRGPSPVYLILMCWIPPTHFPRPSQKLPKKKKSHASRVLCRGCSPCSCSTGSNGQDGEPFRMIFCVMSRRVCCRCQCGCRRRDRRLLRQVRFEIKRNPV